jgi:hypothetical protein
VVRVDSEWAPLRECVYGWPNQQVFGEFLQDSQVRANGPMIQLWSSNAGRGLAEVDPEMFAAWASEINGAVDFLRSRGVIVHQPTTLVLAAGATLAVCTASYTLFVLGTACFAFAWNLVPAFQMGLAAELDPSGRLVVLSIAAVKLGYAAGVSAASFAQSYAWPSLSPLLASLTLTLSVIAFACASRRPCAANAKKMRYT